ncbi:MAG: DinB family protein [Acidobacteria bacterium]|nr:DinB family protein [Acidobacteriota bacterium]
MTNEEKFDRALNRIQQERAAFLSRFDSLSQDQLDFKPSQDSWSVGETAHHVSLTEKVVQENLQALLLAGREEQGATRRISYRELPVAPRMFPGFLLRLAPFQVPFSIMTSFMPSALRSFFLANPVVKVRTAPAVEPRAGILRAELLDNLHQVRDATLQLLEPVRGWDLSCFRWTHPLIGTYDIYGTLEFLANHDFRHGIQIERIKKNSEFPAS